MNEIELSNKTQILVKLLFICSLPFMTLLFLRSCDLWVLVLSMILSFFLGVFLIGFKFKNLFLNLHKKYLLIAFFLGLYIAKAYYNFHTLDYFDNSGFDFIKIPFPISNEFLSLIVSFLSSFAIIFVVYFAILKIWPFIYNGYSKLGNFEKKYLKITLLFTFFVTTILYFFVEGFYYSRSICYDIFYTADSSSLFKGDAFLNLNMGENDLRQPLFGLFALPFALLARLLSEIFFFVPNGYAVFLTTIQIMLLNISILMIGKLLRVNKINLIVLLLMYFCSFSTVVFSFIMEQYIIGLFYLILTVYLFYEYRPSINYAYLGAVSTMLTSGILFPFISKFKNWKYWLKNVFKCFVVFVFLLIMFGQLPQIFSAYQDMQRFASWTGEHILFTDKLMQYVSFVKSIFIAPPAGSIIVPVENFVSYRLEDVTNFSIIGIIILILCFVSLILNRRNKIAIISGIWILFSFLLLCVIGWGTAENGLILYSLYFSWAFIILLYLLVDQIFNNNKIKLIFIITVCVLLCFYNMFEYVNLIQFGLEYYGN